MAFACNELGRLLRGCCKSLFDRKEEVEQSNSIVDRKDGGGKRYRAWKGEQMIFTYKLLLSLVLHNKGLLDYVSQEN